jgi:hypothetical protein
MELIIYYEADGTHCWAAPLISFLLRREVIRMETILAILGLLGAVFTMPRILFDMLTSESENMLSSSRGTPRH